MIERRYRELLEGFDGEAERSGGAEEIAPAVARSPCGIWRDMAGSGRPSFLASSPIGGEIWPVSCSVPS
jgi:hypothetical protein